jgi:IclR family transcriptional regulator, KDG regulon repressor
LEKEKKNIYAVQSVDRAIDILNCFSFEKNKLTLPEIVTMTGLNRSTVRRLVSNLAFRGLLQENTEKKQYQLGLRLFEYGSIVHSSFSLMKAASEQLAQLRNEVGTTTLLAVRSKNQFVVVDKREGQGTISISSSLARRLPLSYSPLGRVFLSEMSDDEIQKIVEKFPLKAHTAYSVTQIDKFFDEINKVRKRGFALDIEEVTEGIMGISAPIRDFSSNVAAVLWLALPATKKRATKYIERMAELVIKTADEVSVKLGYLKTN